VNAVSGSHFGEGQLQVAEANAAESAQQGVSSPSNSDPYGSRKTTRQYAQAVDEKPCEQEFNTVAQSWPG
jgi:hypothetical protein